MPTGNEDGVGEEEEEENETDEASESQNRSSLAQVVGD